MWVLVVYLFSFSGSLALTSDIYRQLALISAHNPPASVPPVSVLTSEERDTWTVARKQLKAANEDSLKLIESAILCLCLDDDDTDNLNDAMRNFLHGNGQNRQIRTALLFRNLIVLLGGLTSPCNWSSTNADSRPFTSECPGPMD